MARFPLRFSQGCAVQLRPFMAGGGVFVGMDGRKGIVKRGPREEAGLRVRILDGMHTLDGLQRIRDELADRADTVGMIDLSRNPLRADVDRRGKAYLIPPAVDGLGEDLAARIGDMNARTTSDRYATIQARPMPYRMSLVSQQVLRYRLACNWCGTLLGWSDRSKRPYLEVVTPDDLAVEYLSDDPLAPTVIRHYRKRVVGEKVEEVEEVYDLTDPEQPSYRIYQGETDVTSTVLGEKSYTGEGYPWRYEDGRAFHRIVISGDPRHPYRGLELVEGTLGTIALQTHWRAGVRDAAYPQRNAIGLENPPMGSDEASRQTGIQSGPERVIVWNHTDPERPGSLHQWGPGFDPEAIGRAIRTAELDLVASMGLPVDFERTGGAPTDTEQRILDEVISSTYPECRGHDSLVLRRVAAICNRATENTPEATAYPERAYGILYREEVRAALAEVAARPAVVENPPDEEE